MYVTLITPSPATFSIWSVIYSLLLISVIVMIVKKDDLYYNSAIDQITVLFRISCIINIAWIIAFSYVQIELSVLFILGFVITLSLICQKLLKIKDGTRWLLPLSFGIYTGWLFIATVVNIAAALVKLNWNGFGIADDIWAIIILIIAILLVVVVLLKNRNAAFPLSVFQALELNIWFRFPRINDLEDYIAGWCWVTQWMPPPHLLMFSASMPIIWRPENTRANVFSTSCSTVFN